MVYVLRGRVEDPEFRRREADDEGTTLHLVGVRIDAEICELESRFVLVAQRAGEAPQNRPDAKRELLEHVWLGDEVVGAELEAAKGVLAGVGCNHDKDGRPPLR